MTFDSMKNDSSMFFSSREFEARSARVPCGLRSGGRLRGRSHRFIAAFVRYLYLGRYSVELYLPVTASVTFETNVTKAPAAGRQLPAGRTNERKPKPNETTSVNISHHTPVTRAAPVSSMVSSAGVSVTSRIGRRDPPARLLTWPCALYLVKSLALPEPEGQLTPCHDSPVPAPWMLCSSPTVDASFLWSSSISLRRSS
jgi:hypothetical protein